MGSTPGTRLEAPGKPGAVFRFRVAVVLPVLGAWSGPRQRTKDHNVVFTAMPSVRVTTVVAAKAGCLFMALAA